MKGLGCRVEGFGLGLRVDCVGLRVRGLGFGV